MTATELCFPRFLPGQVLTDDDLNGLRADYTRRMLDLGALVGFGVGCGLDGKVDGSRLVIEPGYAVDQEGRLLVLRERQSIDLDEVTPTEVKYPFLEARREARRGSFTAVLRAREEPRTAPGPCSDPGCDTHAEMVCERVEVVLAPGALPATEGIESAVLDLEPVRIVNGDQLDRKITDLRKGLVRALGDHVDRQVLGRLAGIDARLTRGALAVQRASLLNTVLVLTWDLYRCLAWMRLTCFRDDRPAGVALGRLTDLTETPVWHCEDRHHFELSAAIARAVLGYRCEDPCRRFRIKIEQVITGYREIEIPAPTERPRDDGPVVIDICKPARHGKHWVYDCPWVYVPPPLVDEPDWFRPPWVDRVPGRDPRPWFDDTLTDPNPLDPWILPADPTHSGVVNVMDLLGRLATDVQPRLVDVLGGAGITTPVEVMTLDEARALDGYRASPVVIGSDRIVIAVDGQGRTVETGSVPTTLGLRGAGPNAAVARTDASAARSEAAAARHDVGEAMEGLGGLASNVEGLELRLEGFSGEVRTVVEQQVGSLMGGVRADLLSEVRTEIGEINDKLSGRIDQVVTGFATGRSPSAIERTAAANEAVYDSLVALREAAGTVREGLKPAARKRFDEELETVNVSLSAVEGAVRSDRPVLETEGASVTAAADALGRALRAAGVTGAPRKEMDDSLRRLGEVVTRR